MTKNKQEISRNFKSNKIGRHVDKWFNPGLSIYVNWPQVCQKKNFYGDRKINTKKARESKWDSFDEFVNIIKEYVENEYYGGFECKIEKGKIVDSKDWRRRKFKYKNDQK